MNKRHFLQAAGAGLLAAALPAGARAGLPGQAHPRRAAGPGGAVDHRRYSHERLQQLYNQTVIVENKPACAGASSWRARRPTATLMVGTIGIPRPASYSKLNHDPAKELQPILVIGEASNIVVVPANSRFKTFADFLAEVRPSRRASARLGRAGQFHPHDHRLFQLAIGPAHEPCALQGQRPRWQPHRRPGGRVREHVLGHGARARGSPARWPSPGRSATRAPAHHRRGRRAGLQRHLVVHAGGARGHPAAVDRLNRDVQKLLAAPDVAERYKPWA